MTRQEILSRAKEMIRDKTQNDGIDDDQCEFCGAIADHEPEELLYVNGQYEEIGEFSCEDCRADLQHEIENGETISQLENVVYLSQR